MKALVLSGGAGFGAYQVGAWQALQEAGWEADIVVGASIGAVNGYVISRGGSLADLREIWLDLPAAIVSSEPRGKRLPIWGNAGLFRTWVCTVARRFAQRPIVKNLRVALTHLPSCAIRVARGKITEKHLLASCSLFGVLPPTYVDGGFHMDGGTFCRLPLRQALLPEVTEIVAVDVLAVPSSMVIRRLVRGAAFTRNFLRRERPEPSDEELSGVRLLRVGHARPLGTTRQCFEWDSERWENLIAIGYRDTKRQIGSSWLVERGQCETVTAGWRNHRLGLGDDFGR